jgi:hypothetical protein
MFMTSVKVLFYLAAGVWHNSQIRQAPVSVLFYLAAGVGHNSQIRQAPVSVVG